MPDLSQCPLSLHALGVLYVLDEFRARESGDEILAEIFCARAELAAAYYMRAKDAQCSAT